MTRESDTDRRQDVLEALADYFIRTGNTRESLRDIGPRIDVSARMLVHYFGSREALIEAALDVARARQLAAAEQLLGRSKDVQSALKDFWTWYKRDDTQQFFVLFSDVAALERAQPEELRQFGARLGSDWIPIFERVFKADPRYAKDAKSIAKLIIATIRGLALDLRNGVEVKDQRSTYTALSNMILAR